MSRHLVCSALGVATLTLAVCSSAYVQTQNEHRPAAQALADLRASAEAGDPKAQFLLGGLYLTGVGVPPDAAEAVAWYRRAAEQGHARAQYNIGAMYAEAEGRGVPPDAAEAVAWYRRAAEQGDAGSGARSAREQAWHAAHRMRNRAGATSDTGRPRPCDGRTRAVGCHRGDPSRAQCTAE